jgi:transposase
MDRDTGIPVMYDIYPGSIVDVSTLVNTLAKLKSHGVREGMFVLDRGFFSTDNIKSLESSGLNYIIPASEILKEVKKVISGIHKQIIDPNNMKIHNGSPLFVKNVTIKIGKHDVSGYCYHSSKQAHEEEEWLYKKLHAIKTTIEGLSRITNTEFKEKVKSIAGKHLRYITAKLVNEKAVVTIRKQVVAQRIKEMGKFILLYKNNNIDWAECLDTYRSRDLIEKGFDILKNDLELATPGVHKVDTLKGMMFVCYLGLLLKMRVLKQLKNSSLGEKYTLPEIMVELSKLNPDREFL